MIRKRLRQSVILPVIGLGLGVTPVSFAQDGRDREMYRTPPVAETLSGDDLESLIPGAPDDDRASFRRRLVITPKKKRVVPPRPPVQIPRVDPSVVRRTQQFLDDAVSLADRGAAFSARAQLVKGMRLIAQSLDAESGTRYFSVSLANGLRALDEASDFAPNGTELEAHLNIDHILATHRTTVLKSGPQPTALAALQMYHAYAEEQLAAAFGREQIASQILMALAKLQPLLVSQDADVTALALPRSMSLYQASLIVDSGNYLAANELGVLFARFGQLQDARDVLAHCVDVDPTRPVAWKNLASVHQKLGEHELAAAATAEWQLAASGGQIPSGRQVPSVAWVDPATFSSGNPTAAAAREAATVLPPKSTPSLVAQRPEETEETGEESVSWKNRFTSMFKKKSGEGRSRR